MTRLLKWKLIVPLLIAVMLAGVNSGLPLEAPRSHSSPSGKGPPMGWDQFNHFNDAITAQIFKQEADALVRSGLRDAGYVYFNVDDSWAGTGRNPDGTINVDQARFPNVKGVNGMVDLIQYVHARGLKFGIYTTESAVTCRGRVGSLGHEELDMRTFASWGVDFLKIDLCRGTSWKTEQDVIHSAQVFYDLSVKYGRPMVISMHVSNTGFQYIGALYQCANMARFFNDIKDTFPSMTRLYHEEIGLTPYSGPGHWNDPDMLEVGNGGMSDREDQTHFSLWAMLAAPLLAGNDLRIMSAATRAILTNKQVIAVDQDPLGKAAHRVSLKGQTEVIARPLANGDYAVLLFNAGTATATIATTTQAVGMPQATTYTLTDLWAHTATTTSGAISASVVPHAVVMFRVHAS